MTTPHLVMVFPSNWQLSYAPVEGFSSILKVSCLYMVCYVPQAVTPHNHRFFSHNFVPVKWVPESIALLCAIPCLWIRHHESPQIMMLTETVGS